VAILAAALVGAAFFGVTPLLAPEVAFFTAMLGPFTMALRLPHATRTCVREDKAIRRSSQWRNAALVSVSPPSGAPEVSHQPVEVTQIRAPTATVGAPPGLRATDSRLSVDQAAACRHLFPAGSLAPICASCCSCASRWDFRRLR
jgi:hypothetical protein